MPDLATALDERETTDLLEIAGVAFVPRGENPPFMPQLRPMDDYWGTIRQDICKNGWKENIERQLRLSIRRVMRSIRVEV